MLVSFSSLIAMLQADAIAQSSFSSNVFYNAGALPEAMTGGDLDGDGDQDLAVINRQGHLRVLVNDGAGCFPTAANHERLWPSTSDGTWPGIPSLTDVALGDLNGDGAADLAVAAGEQNGLVSVVVNSGAGRFASPVSYPACSYTKNVAVGDLNGDGVNDVAATSNCFQATVLLNDGAGALAATGNFGTGYTSADIAQGDLDGDGDNDLAFINIGISTVTVLHNVGDGTFGDAVVYGVGDNPHDVLIADLDGDGDREIATANYYSNDVSVLYNDGSGTFPSVGTFAAGSGPESLAAADLDADGKLDLVVTNVNARQVAILRNLGSGAFALQRRLRVGARPNDVVVSDFNNDGRPDLAVLNHKTENVAVRMNGAASSCQAPPPGSPNTVMVPLHAKPFSSSGSRQVFLYWYTDVRSSTVAVFRNGVLTAITANDSYHWDDVTRRPGTTFVYKVCETGAFKSCSDPVTVTF